MDQYTQPNTPVGKPEFENGSNKFLSNDNSHLYTLVHRLMETVDRQARQISRLESSISEISNAMRNR